MKKTLKLFGLLLTLAILTFSCKEEMTNDPFVNGSATITGTARVELDVTTPEIDYVPSGTRIYARINSEDLVEFPSVSANYGDIVYDTIVGASGSFTFVVAANTKNVTVYLSSDDFIANQTQFDLSIESKVFSLLGTPSVSVHDGVTRITEVTFVEN
jgi:hypothetical protein